MARFLAVRWNTGGLRFVCADADRSGRLTIVDAGQRMPTDAQAVGVMGGATQPQGHVQILLNIIDFGADIQAAIDAPRFRLWEGTRIQIENRFSPAVLQQLSQRGHHLELIGDFNFLVGGGQGVMIDQETGTRLAGADPRRDGYALAW